MNDRAKGERTSLGGGAMGVRSPLWVYLVFVVAPAIFIAVLAYQPFVPFEQLTRDPLMVAGECARFQDELAAAGKCGTIYFGAVSNLGILIWCSAAVVCMFAAAQLYQRRQDMKSVRFMAYAGLFTAFLMFDDLFLAHERVFPILLGIPDLVTYGLYGLIALVYFGLFWKVILRHDVLLLAIGLLALGTSVAVDILVPMFGSNEHSATQFKGTLSHWVIEDGSKFVGISAWAGFHLWAAWQTLTAAEDR